jgi:hypothetical protein
MNSRWHRLVATLRPAKEADRYRVFGRVTLVLAILAAVAFYVLEARPPEPSLDDAAVPGYARARTRELRRQMGQSGVVLAEWEEALTRPGAEAVMIAIGGGLFALYFFRVAHVMDEEERDEQRERRDSM